MRLSRFRVRTFMIAVAIVAALLAIGLELMHLRRLSVNYRYLALGYGMSVQMSLAELAKVKAQFKKVHASTQLDYAELARLRTAIMHYEADIAAHANLIQIHEHAADHPWETPPLVAEVGERVMDAPITKRFLPNPNLPQPDPPSDSF